MASEDIDYSTLYETQPDKYTLNYKALIKYEDLIADTPTGEAARLARIQTGWRPDTFLDNKAYYLEKKAFIIAIVNEKLPSMSFDMRSSEDFTYYIDNYGRNIMFWRGRPDINQYGTKPMTNNQIDTFLSSLASRCIRSHRPYFSLRTYNGNSQGRNIVDLIKDDDNSELEQRVNMLQTQVEQLQSQLASLAPTSPPILSNDTFPVVSNDVPSGVPSGLSNEVPSGLFNDVASRLPNDMNGGKKTKSKSRRNKKTKKHKVNNHNKKNRKN